MEKNGECRDSEGPKVPNLPAWLIAVEKNGERRDSEGPKVPNLSAWLIATAIHSECRDSEGPKVPNLPAWFKNYEKCTMKENLIRVCMSIYTINIE